MEKREGKLNKGKHSLSSFILSPSILKKYTKLFLLKNSVF